MAIATWADYSGGYPGGAALRAAGIAGVIRYVGLGSSSKRITRAEYLDLVANGIEVRLVAELGTHDAEGGYAAGVANARAALADARALGIPDTVGIAAACDEHLTSAQVPTAVQYAHGFADVLGTDRAGAYGFAEFVDAVHAADIVGWWWKCGSAPTAAEAAWITFWQRNAGQTTQTINRVLVDIDDEENTIGGFLVGLNDAEQAELLTSIRDLREQFCGQGCRTTGFTGWPQLGKRTLVDGLGVIGDNQDKYHADLGSKADAISASVGKIPTTQPTLTATLSTDQLAALEQVLTSAIAAQGTANAAEVAATVIADLGALFPKAAA
jgi:hypothetical protein